MDEKTYADPGKKKVLRRIVILCVGAAVLLALLILGIHLLSGHSSRPAPVLVAESSRYEMYEIRTGEVLLRYEITLRNDTGADLDDFALRATLQQDYKQGYILSPAATVRQWGQVAGTTFSLPQGETRTFDLALTAQYFQNKQSPSKALPELYIIYPDGSEGRIEKE